MTCSINFQYMYFEKIFYDNRFWNSPFVFHKVYNKDVLFKDTNLTRIIAQQKNGWPWNYYITCNRFLPSRTACNSGNALIAFLSITLRSLFSRSIRVSRGNPSNAPSRNSRIWFLTSFNSNKDDRLLSVSGDRMFSLLKLKSRTRRAVKPCNDPGNSVKVLCDAYSSRRSL